MIVKEDQATPELLHFELCALHHCIQAEMHSFEDGVKVVGCSTFQAVHPLVREPDLKVDLQGLRKANPVPVKEMITLGIFL